MKQDLQYKSTVQRRLNIFNEGTNLTGKKLEYLVRISLRDTRRVDRVVVVVGDALDQAVNLRCQNECVRERARETESESEGDRENISEREREREKER